MIKMTEELKELENTIYYMQYCANNIFQDDFQEKIERLIKKAQRKKLQLETEA